MKVERQHPLNQENAMKNAPTAEVMTISPAMAAAMLEGQTNVRNVRYTRVAAYAASMLADEWMLTGQPIILNGQKLLDGFNRLTACVKAGVPFTTLVVRGIAAGAVRDMDGGLPRTVGDVLHGEGLRQGAAVAATARLMVAWDSGMLGQYYKESAIPRHAITDYAREHHANIVAALNATRAIQRAVGGSGSAFAASYLRLHPDLRDDFVGSIATGANLPALDARLALRNWLLNRHAAGVRMGANVIVYQVVKAWNFWLAGKETQALKVPPVGALIPQIDQP